MPFGTVAKHARSRPRNYSRGPSMLRIASYSAEGLGPKDQVATTKQALERTGGDVMIVGHLPFLGKLAALLVTGSEANEIVEFQYGSVVCIERHHEGKWKIAWMISPALLHG